jgi:hypothetical protein
VQQIILSILAIMIVMILSLTVMRSAQSSQQRMAWNEISGHVTSIATEVFDHIGRMPFDDAVNEVKAGSNVQFPMVTNSAQLTPKSSAEWGHSNCLDAFGQISFHECEDIDDFDGITLIRNIAGHEYNVRINVWYVSDDAQWTRLNGSQSFLKEVELEIENQNLRVGNSPFVVTVSRVYSYNRITAVPVI